MGVYGLSWMYIFLHQLHRPCRRRTNTALILLNIQGSSEGFLTYYLRLVLVDWCAGHKIRPVVEVYFIFSNINSFPQHFHSCLRCIIAVWSTGVVCAGFTRAEVWNLSFWINVLVCPAWWTALPLFQLRTNHTVNLVREIVSITVSVYIILWLFFITHSHFL